MMTTVGIFFCSLLEVVLSSRWIKYERGIKNGLTFMTGPGNYMDSPAIAYLK